MSVGLVVLLATVLTAPVMIMLAVGALLLGFIVGVPTGFWYHVVLYRIVGLRFRRRPGDLRPTGRDYRLCFSWARYRSGTASLLFVQFAMPCSSIQRYNCGTGRGVPGSAGAGAPDAGASAGGAIGGAGGPSGTVGIHAHRKGTEMPSPWRR